MADIAAASLASIGSGPSASMSMTYAAMTASLGLVLQAAAETQRVGQSIGSASTVRTCELIITMGSTKT